MPSLDRLIKFAAVAEELSFSRASRRLNVDQPWLSRQIQSLESHLGVALFIRNTRHVDLTEEGSRLLVRALQVVEASNKIRSASRDLASVYASTILYGVNPYSYWMPARHELVDRFQARYSRATVKLASHYTPKLISKLRRRLLDVALVPESAVEDEFEYLQLYEARPSLVIPSEDPLAGAAEVALSDLAGRRFAVTDPKLNPEAYAQVYGPLAEAGAIPRVVAEGAHALTYYAAAERLILVCHCWPDSLVAMPPNFTHVDIAGPMKTIGYGLARRHEEHRMVLNQFWNVAADVAGQGALMRSAA